MDIQFRNYEHAKLLVDSPELVNSILLGGILFLVFLTLRAREGLSVLDTNHTEQLKGCSILFILLGHFWHYVAQIWHYVAQIEPRFSLAGFGVAMFFLLSGYGLTVSSLKRKLTIWQYCKKRISRVFIPYWLATIVILFLDYILLDRTLPWGAMIETLLGINIRTVNSHLDYSRWFITLLLLWYILHYVVYGLVHDARRGAITLLGLGAGLFVADYYVDIGWSQLFAFPFGCLLASFWGKYKEKIQQHPKMALAVAAFLLMIVLFCQFFPKRNDFEYIPDIMLLLVREGGSLIFCLSLLTFFGCLALSGKYSIFLSFIGSISYELFLLHGPFLIKYNPIIISGNTLYVSLQVGFFLLIIVLLSFMFKQLHGSLT